MKNINVLKKLVLITIMIVSLSCVNDDEITIAPFPRETIFKETFESAVNNADLTTTGWTNFNEVGTRKWRERVITSSNLRFAEFNPFGSGQAAHVAWLVTPKITTKGYEKYLFTFDAAKLFLDEDSENNSLTAYYSTNFDGTNVLNATWVKIEPLNVPKKAAVNYAYQTSKFQFPISGEIYFAFKFVGNGLPNSTLDGGFQVDNVFVYGLK